MKISVQNKTKGRTTVTMKAEGLIELMKLQGFKSKSKAAQFAVDEALRLLELKALDRVRGTIEFDEEAASCRSFGH